MALNTLVVNLYSCGDDSFNKISTEKFLVAFPPCPEILEKLAALLGCESGELLAFPTQDSVTDFENNGAPLRSIISKIDCGQVDSLISALQRTGFCVSEDGSEATLFVRGPRRVDSFRTPAVVVTKNRETSSSLSSKGSGKSRLEAQNYADIRRFVDTAFPRDERGVLLPERTNASSHAQKRPDWVKELLWDYLREVLLLSNDLAEQGRLYAFRYAQSSKADHEVLLQKQASEGLDEGDKISLDAYTVKQREWAEGAYGAEFLKGHLGKPKLQVPGNGRAATTAMNNKKKGNDFKSMALLGRQAAPNKSKAATTDSFDLDLNRLAFSEAEHAFAVGELRKLKKHASKLRMANSKKQQPARASTDGKQPVAKENGNGRKRPARGEAIVAGSGKRR